MNVSKKLKIFSPTKKLPKISSVKPGRLSSTVYHHVCTLCLPFAGLWVTDKSKNQMDVAMRIAKMVHLFESFPVETFLGWGRACFEIFHREWDKLDKNRISKFLSLARFCLNEFYIFLENKRWNGKVSYASLFSIITMLAREAME